jgi:hypothetical protein
MSISTISMVEQLDDKKVAVAMFIIRVGYGCENLAMLAALPPSAMSAS